MSIRGDVLAGKCPVGEVSFEEVSGRGTVRSGQCPSGKCPSGKCPSGKCQSGIYPWGSDSQESVWSGNCPTIFISVQFFLGVAIRLSNFSCDAFISG